ncbi:MAG TPA: hypothetical protein VHV10_05080 [Ktedonobacteraceae bacterium]|jgi:hypothetical protein|nr:hypothetical protein [Ktedonobacteraceae bacterium]
MEVTYNAVTTYTTWDLWEWGLLTLEELQQELSDAMDAYLDMYLSRSNNQ